MQNPLLTRLAAEPSRCRLSFYCFIAEFSGTFSIRRKIQVTLAERLVWPIIGVLGATGDASIMHNSYGPSGPFVSDIMGQPVTLTRFLMQNNLVTTPAIDMSSEPPGNVGRIEMYYVPEPGALLLLGLGALVLTLRRR